MRVFIFGMIGLPCRLYVCLCLCVKEREGKIQKKRHTCGYCSDTQRKLFLKMCHKRSICNFQRCLWKLDSQKQRALTVQACRERGRSFLPLAIPGTPVSCSHFDSHLSFLFCNLRPVHRLCIVSEILLSLNESIPEPQLLLVF